MHVATDLDDLHGAHGAAARRVDQLAIVGAGRWGRIHARVALSRSPRLRRVHLVARSNGDETRAWAARLDDPRLVVHDDVASLPHDELTAFVVCSRPAAHVRDTRALLRPGRRILVEKPLAQRTEDVEDLLRDARSNDCSVFVGHVYAHERWLHDAAAQVASDLPRLDGVQVTWCDVAGDRHGEPKRPDLSVDPVVDVMPHVATILSVLVGSAPCRDMQVEAPGVEHRQATWTHDDVPVRLEVRRRAAQARRTVSLDLDGEQVEIDFTTAPVTVRRSGLVVAVGAQEGPRPLDRQLDALLGDGVDGALAEARTRARVEATLRAAEAVGRMRTTVMAAALGAAPDAVPATLAEVLVAEFGSGLADSGVSDLHDADALALARDQVWEIVRLHADDAFLAQSDVAATLHVDTDRLRALNAVVRRSSVAQEVITRHGAAAKYWHNSVRVLVRSGAVHAALEGRHAYPYRVGVYPGPSCMFSCTFCGREPGASYDRAEVAEGNARFARMFAEAPRDDPYRFYVAGGLEPLTNPGIGDVVRTARQHGFRMSLYTNAAMLTPKLLARQEGLWDLDALRVSVYGVDEESTFDVTRRKGAHARVRRNVVDLLRLRDERGEQMSVGMNYVVLHDRVDHVLRLLEMIAAINTEAGGRQVDFLSLREDYSLSADDAIGARERERLVEVFAQVERRRRAPDLADLEVDYGYALHPMTIGRVGPPLATVDDASLRPQGFPQVSVVTDLRGDVFLYREAGFVERPGADRYVLGRVDEERGFEQVVQDFVEAGRTVDPRPGDTGFLDAFDHCVTSLLSQADSDARAGVPFPEGPVACRVGDSSPPVDVTALVRTGAGR